MIRHNRLLVAFHLVADAVLGICAFIVAYAIRFHTGLVPITKGLPPLSQYLNVVPFIAVLVPVGFHLQGLYRLRRGRSRVDDFFAVFVGSILAVVFGIVTTLYVQTYFATDAAKDAGTFEVSQLVWALFLALNVVLAFASRELVREVLERRWRAGIGLKRILIAGSGELGRLIADKILEHRELGYQIVGFVDDRAAGDHLGYRGLPLLGNLSEASDITSREAIDHLYVALPPDQHLNMIRLLESTSKSAMLFPSASTTRPSPGGTSPAFPTRTRAMVTRPRGHSGGSEPAPPEWWRLPCQRSTVDLLPRGSAGCPSC